MSTWQQQSKFQVDRATAESAHRFISESTSERHVDAYRYCHHPAMQCDYYRLVILLKRGGIYIDADDMSTGRDLAELLSSPGDLKLRWLCTNNIEHRAATEQECAALIQGIVEPTGLTFYFNNSPIVCEANNPIIALALDRATQEILAAKKSGIHPDIHGTTGPTNLTNAILQYYLSALRDDSTFSVSPIDRWQDYAHVIGDLAYRKTNRDWRKVKANTSDEAAADQDVFRRYYDPKDKTWGGGSGPGSDPYSTIEYRCFLDKFFRMNGIRTVVDVGCGDWSFSRYLDLRGVSYLGLDVVPAVVETNRREFGSSNCRFELMPDSPSSVPGGDLLLMKDVLQHLPSAHISALCKSLLPKFRFALLTNSFRKHGAPQNVDIALGGFRCLDLTAPPFSMGGAYVLEFGSAVWERIRTLLICRPDVAI